MPGNALGNPGVNKAPEAGDGAVLLKDYGEPASLMQQPAPSLPVATGWPPRAGMPPSVVHG